MSAHNLCFRAKIGKIGIPLHTPVCYVKVGYNAEAVLTSTHNLCFRAKIRKIGKPLHTPVLLYKVGYNRVHITWICFPDG